eukprot:TRINITY_DN1627_c0_g1_i14.p1 TRINITY_DN1627_c0_g1~~TRINITY_DN1627_c0_g1_i14.p1  ORF type:complete len:295 (-),score=59.09 TRINITY_DN1627_c0_g1_i14:138-1022(-)
MMTSMGWLLMVFMVVLTVISTASGYVYDRSGTADKSDSYGTYSYDRYGYKSYSRCYDRDANARDNCRNYRAGADRFRGYEDRYNRPSASSDRYNNDRTRDQQTYDRDGDYYDNLRGKVNVGKGVFREINGRDAELTCEFPRGSHLVSNIVWERVGERDSYTRSSNLRDSLGRRMEVERIGDFGSVLIIRDWDERDTGIYRCLATRSYDSSYNYRSSYGRKETIYMEIDFIPRGRSYGSRNEYSGYSSARDDYRDRPYSSRDYGWFRTSGVKASEDTIVTDPNLEKSGKKAEKQE